MKKISNVSFLLAAAVGIVLVLMAAVLLVVSTLLGRALTDVYARNGFAESAAKAIAPSLQLDSKSEVAATLQPFAQNPLFTTSGRRQERQPGVLASAERAGRGCGHSKAKATASCSSRRASPQRGRRWER